MEKLRMTFWDRGSRDDEVAEVYVEARLPIAAALVKELGEEGPYQHHVFGFEPSVIRHSIKHLPESTQEGLLFILINTVCTKLLGELDPSWNKLPYAIDEIRRRLSRFPPPPAIPPSPETTADLPPNVLRFRRGRRPAGS